MSFNEGSAVAPTVTFTDPGSNSETYTGTFVVAGVGSSTDITCTADGVCTIPVEAVNGLGPGSYQYTVTVQDSNDGDNQGTDTGTITVRTLIHTHTHPSTTC